MFISHGIALATVIYLGRTASVYLGIALPICLALVLLTRRPVVSGVVGAIIAMVAAALLRYHLPFDFWAHGNDFIIEPFVEAKIIEEPIGALLSLTFHIGVPTLLSLGLARMVGSRKGSA